LSVTKLFRMEGLHSGSWESKNLKVSVQDVKQSTTDYEKYGTFSIVVRQSSDSDASPKIIERFSGLNLNPDSPDYIARRIGDMKSEWDYTERRYIEQGNFVNNSSYFRVEVSEQVASGLASGLLPMGFYGPVQFHNLNQPAADTASVSAILTAPAVPSVGSILNLASVYELDAGASYDIGPATLNVPVITMPSHPLRSSAVDSKLKDPTDAYFGIEAHYSGSSRQADDYGDLCLPIPNGKDISHSTTQYSFLFTLQDLEAGTSGAAYTAGSYAGASSIDAAGSTFDVLASGYDRFTMPVIGGFDGVDVTEQDPFRNSLLSGKTEINHYAYNSVRRAIDAVSDEEVVECNIITAPGLTDPSLTSHMIDVCERRGDALAIVDIENDYIPAHESSDASDASSRNPSVSSAVASLKTRGINSSYGAAYFPFVKVRDDASGKVIDCPASVVALGTMGSSARKTELWFAPAGFTRGGLSTGSAGLPVTGVRLRLTSKERDKLYEHNINPIASFPSEGIVIFGQKTLQATPSALDRINVRRLMIFLKREVSRMAATVLFDQNVKTTWARFSSKVEPFLASVRTRFGLSEYRLVLDETTTTAELVDRNVMYAKILLKPARSIEYIAIDFVITDSGASFSE
jgi:phage tail sheath protein FI